MGGRAKVPMFTWSTFVRSGATLNLDRPAENEARASNKTLGAPLCTQHGHMHLIHCLMVGEWLIRRAGTHVVRCRRWSVVQFWRAGSSSQQTLKAPFLGVQWLQVLFFVITILTRFKTSSTPILYSSVQRLEWSCDNSVKHLLPSTHFHTHTRSAAELQQVKDA